MRSLHRPGYRYTKAGVMLSDLRKKERSQGDLFAVEVVQHGVLPRFRGQLS
jgi:hypothetical protein